MSKGSSALEGRIDIEPLRDIDQPFVFEARRKSAQYRFEFYDTASPENWRLLSPDLVIICYDISQRLSMINMQRIVRRDHLCLSSLLPPILHFDY